MKKILKLIICLSIIFGYVNVFADNSFFSSPAGRQYIIDNVISNNDTNNKKTHKRFNSVNEMSPQEYEKLKTKGLIAWVMMGIAWIMLGICIIMAINMKKRKEKEKILNGIIYKK